MAIARDAIESSCRIRYSCAAGESTFCFSTLPLWTECTVVLVDVCGVRPYVHTVIRTDPVPDHSNCFKLQHMIRTIQESFTSAKTLVAHPSPEAGSPRSLVSISGRRKVYLRRLRKARWTTLAAPTIGLVATISAPAVTLILAWPIDTTPDVAALSVSPTTVASLRRSTRRS